MNDEQQQEPSEAQQPSEEELRRRIEEQLRKVRVQDLLLESVVSIINLVARRVTKEDERDLDQARIGIEAVRAVVDLLDKEPAKQVRSALSEVQMLYAKEAQAAEGEPGAPPTPASAEEKPTGAQPPSPGETGRARSKLWTPPGT